SPFGLSRPHLLQFQLQCDPEYRVRKVLTQWTRIPMCWDVCPSLASRIGELGRPGTKQPGFRDRVSTLGGSQTDVVYRNYSVQRSSRIPSGKGRSRMRWAPFHLPFPAPYTYFLL